MAVQVSPDGVNISFLGQLHIRNMELGQTESSPSHFTTILIWIRLPCTWKLKTVGSSEHRIPNVSLVKSSTTRKSNFFLVSRHHERSFTWWIVIHCWKQKNLCWNVLLGTKLSHTESNPPCLTQHFTRNCFSTYATPSNIQLLNRLVSALPLLKTSASLLKPPQWVTGRSSIFKAD